jgi:riboflavin synthase
MFTGIITAIGEITAIERQPGADLRATIRSSQPLDDVAIGASIACSGVCLTVTSIADDCFTVDISDETLARTVSDHWQTGSRLNLERALKLGDELGGHIVTGHVDGVGAIRELRPIEGSVDLAILAPASLAEAIAAKGSIAVDGISLTVNSVQDEADGQVLFRLNIIPHTAMHTTLASAAVGKRVNLEIDVLARYLARMLDVRQTQ